MHELPPFPGLHGKHMEWEWKRYLSPIPLPASQGPDHPMPIPFCMQLPFQLSYAINWVTIILGTTFNTPLLSYTIKIPLALTSEHSSVTQLGSGCWLSITVSGTRCSDLNKKGSKNLPSRSLGSTRIEKGISRYNYVHGY